MSSPRSPAVPFIPDDRRQVGRYLLAERLFHHERQVSRASPDIDNTAPATGDTLGAIRDADREKRARLGVVPPEDGILAGPYDNVPAPGANPYDKFYEVRRLRRRLAASGGEGGGKKKKRGKSGGSGGRKRGKSAGRTPGGIDISAPSGSSHAARIARRREMALSREMGDHAVNIAHMIRRLNDIAGGDKRGKGSSVRAASGLPAPPVGKRKAGSGPNAPRAVSAGWSRQARPGTAHTSKERGFLSENTPRRVRIAVEAAERKEKSRGKKPRRRSRSASASASGARPLPHPPLGGANAVGVTSLLQSLDRAHRARDDMELFQSTVPGTTGAASSSAAGARRAPYPPLPGASAKNAANKGARRRRRSGSKKPAPPRGGRKQSLPGAAGVQRSLSNNNDGGNAEREDDPELPYREFHDSLVDAVVSRRLYVAEDVVALFDRALSVNEVLGGTLALDEHRLREITTRLLRELDISEGEEERARHEISRREAENDRDNPGDTTTLPQIARGGGGDVNNNNGNSNGNGNGNSNSNNAPPRPAPQSTRRSAGVDTGDLPEAPMPAIVRDRTDGNGSLSSSDPIHGDTMGGTVPGGSGAAAMGAGADPDHDADDPRDVELRLARYRRSHIARDKRRHERKVRKRELMRKGEYGRSLAGVGDDSLSVSDSDSEAFRAGFTAHPSRDVVDDPVAEMEERRKERKRNRFKEAGPGTESETSSEDDERLAARGRGHLRPRRPSMLAESTMSRTAGPRRGRARNATVDSRSGNDAVPAFLRELRSANNAAGNTANTNGSSSGSQLAPQRNEGVVKRGSTLAPHPPPHQRERPVVGLDGKQKEIEARIAELTVAEQSEMEGDPLRLLAQRYESIRMRGADGTQRAGQGKVYSLGAASSDRSGRRASVYMGADNSAGLVRSPVGGTPPSVVGGGAPAHVTTTSSSSSSSSSSSAAAAAPGPGSPSQGGTETLATRRGRRASVIYPGMLATSKPGLEEHYSAQIDPSATPAAPTESKGKLPRTPTQASGGGAGPGGSDSPARVHPALSGYDFDAEEVDRLGPRVITASEMRVQRERGEAQSRRAAESRDAELEILRTGDLVGTLGNVVNLQGDAAHLFDADIIAGTGLRPKSLYEREVRRLELLRQQRAKNERETERAARERRARLDKAGARAEELRRMPASRRAAVTGMEIDATPDEIIRKAFSRGDPVLLLTQIEGPGSGRVPFRMDAPLPFGSTPLCEAAERGHVALVEVLIARGADINVAGPDGALPIHAACRGAHDNPGVVCEIMDAHDRSLGPGCLFSGEIADPLGRFPVHIAAMHGHREITAALVGRARRALLGVREAKKAEHDRKLRDHAIASATATTATAAQRGESDGHDGNGDGNGNGNSAGGDGRGSGAATAAAPDIPQAPPAPELMTVEAIMVKTVDPLDPSGESPLHHAARHGHAEVVRLLLSLGCDRHRVSLAGDRPIDVCGRGSAAATVLVNRGPELERAALTIQACVRSWIARRVVGTLRARKLAATHIQRVWRGYSVRKRMQDEQEYHAAVVIQCTVRRCYARRLLAWRRWAAANINRVMRGGLVRVRIRRARIARQTEAVLVFQRAYRAGLTRAGYCAARRSIVGLQAIARGAAARRMVSSLSRASIMIARMWRGRAQRRIFEARREEHRRLTSAAVVIQSAARRWLARARVARIIDGRAFVASLVEGLCFDHAPELIAEWVVRDCLVEGTIAFADEARAAAGSVVASIVSRALGEDPKRPALKQLNRSNPRSPLYEPRRRSVSFSEDDEVVVLPPSEDAMHQPIEPRASAGAGGNATGGSDAAARPSRSSSSGRATGTEPSASVAANPATSPEESRERTRSDVQRRIRERREKQLAKKRSALSRGDGDTDTAATDSNGNAAPPSIVVSSADDSENADQQQQQQNPQQNPQPHLLHVETGQAGEPKPDPAPVPGTAEGIAKEKEDRDRAIEIAKQRARERKQKQAELAAQSAETPPPGQSAKAIARARKKEELRVRNEARQKGEDPDEAVRLHFAAIDGGGGGDAGDGEAETVKSDAAENTDVAEGDADKATTGGDADKATTDGDTDQGTVAETTTGATDGGEESAAAQKAAARARKKQELKIRGEARSRGEDPDEAVRKFFAEQDGQAGQDGQDGQDGQVAGSGETTKGSEAVHAAVDSEDGAAKSGEVTKAEGVAPEKAKAEESETVTAAPEESKAEESESVTAAPEESKAEESETGTAAPEESKAEESETVIAATEESKAEESETVIAATEESKAEESTEAATASAEAAEATVEATSASEPSESSAGSAEDAAAKKAAARERKKQELKVRSEARSNGEDPDEAVRKFFAEQDKENSDAANDTKTEEAGAKDAEVAKAEAEKADAEKAEAEKAEAEKAEAEKAEAEKAEAEKAEAEKAEAEKAEAEKAEAEKAEAEKAEAEKAEAEKAEAEKAEAEKAEAEKAEAEKAEAQKPDPPSVTLHHAAQTGTLSDVLAHIALGSPLDDPDANGFTPLSLAVYSGHLQCAEALIGAGADPSAPISGGFTPLHLVSQSIDPEAVASLVKWGADPDARSGNGSTPLLVVDYTSPRAVDVLRELLGGKGGADPTVPDDEGTTALHFAATAGNEEACRMLIAHGATVDVEDTLGAVPGGAEDDGVTTDRLREMSSAVSAMIIRNRLARRVKRTASARSAASNESLELSTDSVAVPEQETDEQPGSVTPGGIRDRLRQRLAQRRVVDAFSGGSPGGGSAQGEFDEA